jgi:hypothetical protein
MITQCELEVQKIIHLQNITNQLIKSHILAANTPSRIEICKKKNKGNTLANKSISSLKRRRLIGAKDKNPRK